MRINGHAHIFNLQTVLSAEAIAIMVNRLRRIGIPDLVADAVEELLEEQLDHPEYLNERELLARFVRKMTESAAFDAVAGLPAEVRVLGGGSTSGLTVRALEAVLNRISEALADVDGVGKRAVDVFQTLRIAMQPDIPRVASKLLSHLGPDDALVALMMDITATPEGERDRLNFRRQIRGTMDAVLAHPGRVLPFIAVNPARSDHFRVMERAIEEQGFLGVKLYPSLGYQLVTDEIRAVLRFCRDRDVPITIHTSAGGFRRDAGSADFCHPRHWAALLEDDDPLRVCFAHCGGWGGFCGQDPDQVEWADRILAYMEDYPGVYADISYHVDQMRSAALETAYFDALRTLIDGDRGDRIVFGTDSWLLRLSIDDALYWTYFEHHLGKDRLDRIARDVPAAFLGLPLDGSPPRENIARHLRFLEAHAAEVGAAPAPWVRDASDATWAVIRRDTSWSLNNWAHRLTYSYLQDQLPATVPRGDFAEAGPIRLRQLQYFRQRARGPSARVIEGKALELMHMSARHGQPEPGHDDASILAALQGVLGDPDLTVAEVGASVDAFYRFAPETV
ncbi:MAG TPA: amidohydrolase family protein [Longimicrobiales bacterium]|nr:amidohydrolase family protein [Longimicrobiales bacterium]